jgi:transcriptional regulator GlxA family with amidase domain
VTFGVYIETGDIRVMGRREADFQSSEEIRFVSKDLPHVREFVIYVSSDFCDFEHAQICQTLRLANTLLVQPLFAWRVVSHTPGFVHGLNGVIVEAKLPGEICRESSTMIVLGGAGQLYEKWVNSVRVMQHKMLPVVLLSDAATTYIQRTRTTGKVTTHWRDALQLAETGYYPNLSNRFSEKSNGVITAAGGASTVELMIGLLAPFLTSAQVAELGSRLLLNTIRKSDAEQPKCMADNASLFDRQITHAIRVMEGNIAEPLQMTELADQIGVSTRHLERAFRSALSDTPARFYKRMRAKRAKAMIEETLLPLIDVAVATGFGSTGSLSKTVRDEYGASPTKMRDRKKICLLTFVD